MTATQHDNRALPPEDLTDTERGLWEAFEQGATYDLRSRDPAQNDPAGLHVWGPERSVRAVFLARLLLHGPEARPGRVSALKLAGAFITGTLDLSGGRVSPYVELRNCRFENEVLLPECSFTTLRLVECSIPRLEAARLSTSGDLHLPRCTVDGGIRLTDAQIGTDLLLSQLTVGRDRRGRAISADGVAVGQDLQADLLQAHGEVRLRGATVGVSLNLSGSVLRNPYGKRALNAPQLTVERSLHMAPESVPEPATGGMSTPPYGIGGHTPPRGTRMQHFECYGGLRLDDGRFGDSVDLDDARFVMDPEQEMSLRRIHTPELRFMCRIPEGGRVVLSGARVVNLRDKYTSWPGPGSLAMAGFRYEHLIPVGSFPLERRLEWVEAATPEFSPEPYEVLSTVLRDSGEDHEARQVMLAKHRRHRETLPVTGKVWGLIQDWTVAYGYRPTRAVLWMAVLWAVGTFYFARHSPRALRPGEGPQWNPPLYVLDLLLPVIDLGQDNAWHQSGHYQWTAAVLVLSGWVLATTVAAGVSRALRRQ